MMQEEPRANIQEIVNNKQVHGKPSAPHGQHGNARGKPLANLFHPRAILPKRPHTDRDAHPPTNGNQKEATIAQTAHTTRTLPSEAEEIPLQQMWGECVKTYML
jgi:hypothetical protein